MAPQLRQTLGPAFGDEFGLRSNKQVYLKTKRDALPIKHHAELNSQYADPGAVSSLRRQSWR